VGHGDRDEVEGERISWQTLPGADIRNAGNLILKDAPGGRGTEVHLRLAYDAPAGAWARRSPACSARSRTPTPATTCAG
jgi:uncharacterized membrane protein